MLVCVRCWKVSPKHSPLATFLFWANYFGAMPEYTEATLNSQRELPQTPFSPDFFCNYSVA
jgi:hypothetical protein